MNTLQANLPNSNNTLVSSVYLSDDLIAEVLSYLSVKSLMQLKSVCKSWYTLISHPTFIELHLQRPTRRNRHIAVIKSFTNQGCNLVTYPLNHLLENPSIDIACDPYCQYRLKLNYSTQVVGPCNGLLCLFTSRTRHNNWFYILNPATRIISEKLGSFDEPTILNFGFGYDNLTKTYKVVASTSSEVKVFSFGDNIWRKISSFPPFDHVVSLGSNVNIGVYLSGTVNWLVIREKMSIVYPMSIIVQQFVILSLDLGTETYKLLLPPRVVDEVPQHVRTIAVLMDCLCFSYISKGTHFVIWQMKEFGVEESWTQFLKISLQVFSGRCRYYLFPFCLSKNGDTLILASYREDRAIIYNIRDNRVEETSDIALWSYSKDYVESLASIC